jgi:methylated-DNA-[protein]-cysteine S-methyltransferase
MNFVSTFSLQSFRLPDFSLAVDESEAVIATAFGDVARLQTRLTPRPTSPGEVRLIADEKRTEAAREQILAYFAGELRDFTVQLAPAGSSFQHRVWALLRAIPFGETRNYGQLAAQLGSAPRAVGRANATNPICLIVPCHRVIGADGALTGFAFGEDVKRRLLTHEGVLSSAAGPVHEPAHAAR